MPLFSVGIVGGGFTGLTAARRLARAGISVTVFDKNDHALFTPRLIDALAGQCTPQDVRVPHARLADRYGYTFVHASVTRVNQTTRTVYTLSVDDPKSSTPHTFDKLVLSPGARTAFFGIEAAHVFPFKTWEDLIRLEEHLAQAPSHTPLSIGIVGGGATGVELAIALDERLQQQGRDRATYHLSLLFAGASILQGFSPNAVQAAEDALRSRGILLQPHTVITAVTQDTLSTRSGEHTPKPSILVWAAGVTPTPLEDESHQSHPEGLLPDHALRLAEGVFAGGDAISLRERQRPLPKNAQTAMKMGNAIADTILRAHHGKRPRSFCYRSIGAMVWLGSTATFDLLGYAFTSPFLVRVRQFFYTLRWWQMTKS